MMAWGMQFLLRREEGWKEGVPRLEEAGHGGPHGSGHDGTQLVHRRPPPLSPEPDPLRTWQLRCFRQQDAPFCLAWVEVRANLIVEDAGDSGTVRQ